MAEFTNDQAALIASATMRRPTSPSSHEVIRDAEAFANWLNRQPPVDHTESFGDKWLGK